MILRYFKKNLKTFILAKLQNENYKLKNFVQIVKKIIIAKTKAKLQSQATTKDIDKHSL